MMEEEYLNYMHKKQLMFMMSKYKLHYWTLYYIIEKYRFIWGALMASGVKVLSPCNCNFPSLSPARTFVAFPISFSPHFLLTPDCYISVIKAQALIQK